MPGVKVNDPRDIQGAHEDRFNQLKAAEATPSQSYTDAGIDQLEAHANDPANATIRDEEQAGAGETPTWQLNRDTPSKDTPQNLSPKERAVKLLKKGGPSAIVVTALIGGGSILGSFLGAGSLAVSIAENAISTNDSSSTAMERRFIKFFANNTNPGNNDICKSSVRSVKCKMGRISNNSIKALSKKGVIAVVDGQEYKGKTLGYPDKNPDSYKFPDGRGNYTTVKAENLRSFLLDSNNRELASRVMGVRGAFNMRFKAWASKVIDKKFYKKFNLKRDGGVADGSGIAGDSPEERRKSMLQKLQERIPGLDKIASANDFPKRMSDKMSGHMKRAGRAGAGYTLAVSSCIAMKLPGYIATGIAAIQLAQVLPYAMDTVLSPSSKQKASTIGSGFTTDDADKVGTLLTEKDKNGKSAMDSPILLAAMGINKNPPAMSKKYTPGYSVMTNGIVKAASSASKETKGACNAIMSPSAMYTAMAVDSAVTLAASATIIGGLIKLAVGFVVTEVATKMMESFGEEAAKAALTSLAENDDIPKAQGQEFGDVLGISLTSFFSGGSMARGLPALKESQLGEFQAMKQENDNFQREMDIASLSPFDTSSKYTFLGSMVYNAQMAVIQNGGYGSNSFLSTLTGIASMPMAALSPTAGAASYYSNQYCSYADDVGLDTKSDSDPDGYNTPAINLAGMPCTGITPQQASMTTERALDLLSNEGWLDLDKETQDGMTLDDMITSGVIKDETPLSEFIKSCSQPDSGDYLMNSAGCTVNSPKTSNANLGNGCLQKYDDKGNPVAGQQVCPTDNTADLPDVKNPESLAAMSVFLIDYQMMQGASGEDDPEAASTSPESSTPQTTAPAGDFTFYTQGSGAPWAQKLYTDESYAIEGCGPTAAAMVIATFKDKSVTPEIVGSWMAARPGIPFAGDRLPEVFANWGLQSEVFGAGSAGAEQKIIDALKAGKLVVVSGKGGTPFTSGGHFIVLRGLEGDKILIGDPAKASNNTVAFDQATIFNQYHNAVNIISKP